MTDDVSVGFQPEQEAGQSSEADQQVEGKETPQQQYVTLDQFRQFEDSLKRTIQSLTDKAETRISKQVKEQVASLQEIAKELENLPPNTPAAVRDRIYDQAFSSVGDALGNAPAQEMTPEIAMTNATAKMIEINEGIELEEGDPELSSLVQNKGPKEFLKSFKAALSAKKTRLEGATQTTQGGSPIARMPAMAGGTPSKGLDALTMELNRLNEKTGKTTADLKRMRELGKEISEVGKTR